MKAILKKTGKVFMVTFGLPFLLVMALGYWLEAEDDTTYWQAVKKCL